MLFGIVSYALAIFRRFPGLFLINTGLALLLTAAEGLSIFSLAPLATEFRGQPDATGTIAAFGDALLAIGITPSFEIYLSFFAVTIILRDGIKMGIQYFVACSKQIVIREIISELAHAVLHASANFFASRRQGDFVNTMTNELAKVGDAFGALSRCVSPIAQIIFLAIAAVLISWQLTVISLGLIFCLVLPLQYVNQTLYSRGVRHTESGNRFLSALDETFSRLRLIAGFGNAVAALGRIDRTFVAARDAHLSLSLIDLLVQSAYGPIAVAVVVATFFAGHAFDIPVQQTIMVVFTLHRLANVIRELEANKNTLLSSFGGFQQVQRISSEAQSSRLKFGSVPFDRLETGIHLDNVGFAYPATASGVTVPPALHDVDLSIPKGKCVALVGESGAGKSTLIDLIMGFQIPQSGAIRLNGRPLTDYEITSYRQKIGFVPQNNLLFHDTIRANICWAKSDATDEEIMAACTLADAHDFIMAQEHGYDTIVGDRGDKLSGGQVQRIALARALVRNPELLILDEATSALDSVSEKQIQTAVENITGRMTIILIAHRLSTIAKADIIYVLSKGRVIEQGTFEELSSRGGKFADLVNIQRL